MSCELLGTRVSTYLILSSKVITFIQVVVKKVEAEEVAQVTVLNSVILPHPNRHQLRPVPHHHSILFLENKLIPRVQVEYSKERTSMFNVVENARTSHTVLHLMQHRHPLFTMTLIRQTMVTGKSPSKHHRLTKSLEVYSFGI